MKKEALQDQINGEITACQKKQKTFELLEHKLKSATKTQNIVNELDEKNKPVGKRKGRGKSEK